MTLRFSVIYTLRHSLRHYIICWRSFLAEKYLTQLVTSSLTSMLFLQNTPGGCFWNKKKYFQRFLFWVGFCLKHMALQIIQILFALNGDWKESIYQRNVSFAQLKFAEWRSTFKLKMVGLILIILLINFLSQNRADFRNLNHY